MIFQSFEIQEAARCLQKGGIVAFPTETVYGLGASIFQPEAVQKIFQVKGRPQDNPLIVHICSLSQLSTIVKELPPGFDRLAQAFFPGPLTLILPKREEVPSIVSAHLPTIGVRMPSHPLALRLIETAGFPLAAPSANLSGRPSSTTAQHVLEDFGTTICGVVDGGACEYGIESTVLSLLPTPRILRPGAISEQQLEEVLKCPVPIAERQVEKPLCPGSKYRHYAPRAQVIAFDSKKALESYLGQTPRTKRTVLHSVQPEALYALFRQADAEGCEEIVIFCDKTVKRNAALLNRIRCATEGGLQEV
jgi:L-threonylcarbamoyladenylate synthase